MTTGSIQAASGRFLRASCLTFEGHQVHRMISKIAASGLEIARASSNAEAMLDLRVNARLNEPVSLRHMDVPMRVQHSTWADGVGDGLDEGHQVTAFGVGTAEGRRLEFLRLRRRSFVDPWAENDPL